MRKVSFATVVAVGIAPFFAAGCTSNSGPTMAAGSSSTDWFGAKKLATLFKRDAAQMPTTDTPNPSDPTSLAYKGKPAGADLYVATAKLYEKQNNIPAAEDQYQRALKTAPSDVPAMLGYAHLLDRQGKLDQATAYYTQVVQLAPHNAAAHNDLGLCYARRGMLNESLAALSKAVEIAPEKKLYRNNIATVLVEMGQRERASSSKCSPDRRRPPRTTTWRAYCTSAGRPKPLRIISRKPPRMIPRWWRRKNGLASSTAARQGLV